MPKTKAQKCVFSLLMAFIMVYGMETYNHVIAGLGAASFMLPVDELLALMLAVIILQELIAGRLARKIAFHFVRPDKHKTFTIVIATQIATVSLMCPLMSFVATLVFKRGILMPLAEKWLLTVAVNMPMAMLWQLFVAGPIVRGVVERVKI